MTILKKLFLRSTSNAPQSDTMSTAAGQQRVKELITRLPIVTELNFALASSTEVWNGFGTYTHFFAEYGRDYSGREILALTRKFAAHLDRHRVRMSVEVQEWQGKGPGPPPILCFGGSEKYTRYGRTEWIDRGHVYVVRVGPDVFKACYKRSTLMVDFCEQDGLQHWSTR